MATIPIQGLFLAGRDPSNNGFPAGRQVLELALSTFKANTIIQADANGRYGAAPATPTDGTLKTGLAFAMEDAHNYAVNSDWNKVEAALIDQEFEINLKGNALTAAQLKVGAQYGFSIDGTTGFYVLDVAKTTHVVAEITGLPRRGVMPGGSGPYKNPSGVIGDDNVRVFARLIRSAGNL